MKKTSHTPLAFSIVTIVLLITVGLIACYPYPLINPERDSNMLLLDNDNRLLSTASPATLFYNHYFPDKDETHGRILVRRPSDIDTLSRYPLVVVLQSAGEDFRQLCADWPAMNSCYVMVMSGGNKQSPPHHAGLALLDSTLVPLLNHEGMRIDPDYITLIDRTGAGQASRQMRHRPLRNLVLTHHGGDTTAKTARRTHFVPTDVADTAHLAQAYRSHALLGLDADLHPSLKQPLHATVRDIATERNPIAQSRLERTHRQVLERGCDERYVMFVDFSIPSGKNRFFLYDYRRGDIAVSSKCAHGCGSGSTDAMPQFNNEPGSCASSLGSYRVDDIHRMYKNGRVAINLEGLEASNDNARLRGIKIHGGMSSEGEIYPHYLRIGRLSEGCFALSNVPLSSVLVIVEQTVPRHIMLTAYTH